MLALFVLPDILNFLTSSSNFFDLNYWRTFKQEPYF